MKDAIRLQYFVKKKNQFLCFVQMTKQNFINLKLDNYGTFHVGLKKKLRDHLSGCFEHNK